MKAPEEVAMLSMVKSSHMCLRAWKGKQQLEECVKGKEGWLELSRPLETGLFQMKQRRGQKVLSGLLVV